MELRSESVRTAIDQVETTKKVTAVSATIEMRVYPDGHAAIAGHPVSHREELLAAVGYLFDRLHEQSLASKG